MGVEREHLLRPLEVRWSRERRDGFEAERGLQSGLEPRERPRYLFRAAAAAAASRIAGSGVHEVGSLSLEQEAD